MKDLAHDIFTPKKVVLALVLLCVLLFCISQIGTFTKTYHRWAVDDSSRYEAALTGKSVEHDGWRVVESDDLDGLYVAEGSSRDEDDPAYIATLDSISLVGSTEVRQQFTAKGGAISDIALHFSNPAQTQASGIIRVSIEGEDGQRVCVAQLDVNSIRHQVATTFVFQRELTDPEETVTNARIIAANQELGYHIGSGKTATIVIESIDVEAPGGFSVYMFPDIVEGAPALSEGSTVFEDRSLVCMAAYTKINLSLVIIFYGLILLAMALVLLPLKRVEAWRIKRNGHCWDLNKVMARVILVLTPFACLYINTKMSGYGIRKTVDLLLSPNGALNMFLIVMIILLAYLIVNRIKYAAAIGTIAWGALAFGSYLMIIWRGTPFMATDFASLTTAMGVAGSYICTFDQASVCALSTAVMWLCLTLCTESYRSIERWRMRLIPLLVFAVGGVVFHWLFFGSDFLEENGISVSEAYPTYSYKTLGYPLAFWVTATTIGVDEPDGYSVQAVRDIAAEYPSDAATPAEEASQANPNIIVVMDESYSDLRVIEDFAMSEELTPFYRSLDEDVVKGTLHTSVLGGGTANSEFEFLTGDTAAFLPYASIAFTSILRDDMPSIARTLAAQGYGGNVAFHPGERGAYSRDVNYPRLGFEQYLCLDDVQDPAFIRNYLSDASDFANVERLWEEYQAGEDAAAPFFLYNVTIQNHGGYMLSSGVVDGSISIEDADLQEEEASQYVRLVRQTDAAMEQLITYFRSVDEPTVIVFFGDHQPKVGTDFYNQLYGKTNLSLEERERQYQVPFMIWANYDIPEEENVQISANYLHSYLLQMLGMPMTGYEHYLMEQYRELPVITSVCYMDAQGEMYSWNSSSRYDALLRRYQLLQYNNLIDTENTVWDFFSLAS